MKKQAEKLLKQYFGFDEFRPLQEEVVETVMGGRDAVVLMPTGGGKSLCYQLPALMLPGVTVVVSPLIALMKDQVESLRANGVAAEFLNSSLSADQAREVVKKLKAGEVKLVYVAPERLLTEGFLELLRQMKISLLVVDEAHCISVWGHSFRKEYTQLKRLREEFEGVAIMALTATADEVTRKDMVKQLRLKQAKEFVASFDRPNIRLVVLPSKSRARRVVELVQERQDQAGIIYCLSRKETERVAEKLKDAGIKAEFYHAEVTSNKRSRRQEKFVRDEVQVMVATVAFGMGIDKSNVRYVIHHNMPPNLESYYQEIGRAGRDGLESEAIMFYSPADVMRWEKMLKMDDLEEQEREVKLKKLRLMQRWAEGLECRRYGVLKYFGEKTGKKCGNCDICLEPPEEFEGTKEVQMALSVLVRVGKPLSLGAIVGILRGSRAEYIWQNGWDRIKTYGVGKGLGAPAWRQYLRQMMEFNLIRYEESKLGWWFTDKGKEVLLGQKVVALKRTQVTKKKPKVKKEVVKKAVSEMNQVEWELFERLRKLRTKLANQEKVPAYIVFSDATLKDMAVKKPKNKEEMMGVSGVGEVKWERYGEVFLREIGKDE